MKIFNKIIFVLILVAFGLFTVGEVFAQDPNANPSPIGGNVPQGPIGGNVPQGPIGGNVPQGPIGGNVPSPSPGSSGVFTLQNPLKVNSIGGLINLFIEIFTYLVILFAVLMFIYLGFKYVLYSSQGNTKGISELHSQFLWLVVGVGVVIGARFLIEIIINTLSATGTISPGVIESANNAIQNR